MTDDKSRSDAGDDSNASETPDAKATAAKATAAKAKAKSASPKAAAAKTAAAKPDSPKTASPKAAAANAASPKPDHDAPRSTAPRAASAASRARRIGGGIAPARARIPHPSGAETPAVDQEAGAVSVKKRPTMLGHTKPSGAAATKSSETKSSETKSSGTKSSENKSSVPSTSPKKKRVVPAWLAWVPTGVFALVAIVFLSVFVANQVGGDDQGTPSSKQRQTVLAAAKNCVAATNTYRYTDIDKYERAGLACATGQYKTQYRSAMDTLIKKNAPTQKFTQIAQVNTAGIESVTKSGKQWAVLIYGQLNITNTRTGKQGRIDPFAVIATMEQVNGAWLMAGVRLLSTIGG